MEPTGNTLSVVFEGSTCHLGQARHSPLVGGRRAARATGESERPVVPRAPQVVWRRKEERGDTCRASRATLNVVHPEIPSISCHSYSLPTHPQSHSCLFNYKNDGSTRTSALQQLGGWTRGHQTRSYVSPGRVAHKAPLPRGRSGELLPLRRQVRRAPEWRVARAVAGVINPEAISSLGLWRSQGGLSLPRLL